MGASLPPRPSCSNDIRKLLRAYNLLVVTSDDERAIIGQVSRKWLEIEREDWVRLSDIPSGVLRTVRGREVLCDALLPDLDMNHELVDLDSLLQQASTSDKFINSNSLPKLEPAIAAEVLLGNMLLGVQMYGNRRCGSPSLDNDLIIAAMLRNTPGRADRYSAVLPADCAVVDLDHIEHLFGASVVHYLCSLRSYLDAFGEALQTGSSQSLQLPRPYASVIAAIEAASLRLIARAAGDEILSNLPTSLNREARSAGLDCDGKFPEREFLQSQFDRARAALHLPGVDYSALGEPLQQTLMIAVADALEQPNKRCRLVGRRGKAVHEVHRSLPLVENFNASENFNSLATVHIAALEMMQFLEKGRRKSCSTMLGHSLRIAGVAERLLGGELAPSIATTAILHDIVEDGSRPVAGYDQSLNNIKLRFGGPMASMVAELTDAESTAAGVQKAQATLKQKDLILPEQQYNVDRFTEMALEPTAAHEPYTLGGIVIKLIDTAMSEEEGIRDPDVMSQWWKHSGIRIYWSHNVRGRIVRPLLLKLTQEVERYQREPETFDDRRWNDELIEGLRRVAAFSISSADKYAIQNLAILADEHQLSVPEREVLIRNFFDRDVSAADFASQIVDRLLCESRLQSSIHAGVVPDTSYVTLYRKRRGGEFERDSDTFLQYRSAALIRRDLAQRLQLPECSDSATDINSVVWLYDLRKVA